MCTTGADADCTSDTPLQSDDTAATYLPERSPYIGVNPAYRLRLSPPPETFRERAPATLNKQLLTNRSEVPTMFSNVQKHRLTHYSKPEIQGMSG